MAISAITLVELLVGPAASDGLERARRRGHLRRIEAVFDVIVFDGSCARAYVGIYARVVACGRKPRGGRALDLLIAATALAHELPLYTRNAADLRGLDGLIEIVDLA